MNHRRRTAAVPISILIVLLLTVSAGTALGPGGPAAAPVGPSTHGAPSPPAWANLATRPAAPVHPGAAPNCQDPNTDDDAYNPIVGGVSIFPFWVFPGYQNPCLLTPWDPNLGGTFNDEAHLTFSSSAARSASDWSVPIRLPTVSGVPQSTYLWDFYVGEVVRGDSNSVFNQSYLSVLFDSNTDGTAYNLTLSVLALHGGNCSALGTFYGLDLTFNGNYACEMEMLGGTSKGGPGINLTHDVSAGDYLDITFTGVPNQDTTGLSVYINDTTHASLSSSYTLSSAPATANLTYVPYYSSSCADLCYLNWSMPFGAGFGADINYDTMYIPYQQEANPVWIGVPTYATSSGGSKEYTYTAFESGSGACGGQANTISCGQLPGGTSYPYFQFNGSDLNFGSGNDFNWTTEDFGTSFFEYNAYGTPNDVVPLWLDQVHNDTQAGYVAPNTGINVSVRAQDFGTVDYVNVSYQLPTGPGTLALARASGNASIGRYVGKIPSSGGNGLITWTIIATNAAGQTLTLPGSGRFYQAVRGPIPLFTLGFATNPPACGHIEFNGVNYTTHQSITLPAGSYDAVAHPCYPYVMQRWDSSGLTLNASSLHSYYMTVNLTANATLTAIFRYVRPFDTVYLRIDTNDCGQIVLNGTAYSQNTSVQLLDRATYALSFSNCALNAFSGWVVDVPQNVSILGGVPASAVTLSGNGTIELTYLPTGPTTIPLILDSSPVRCGHSVSNGILFRGAGYTNGTTLDVQSGGSYPIAPDPCATWGLKSWATTSGITISGTSVTVTAPGMVTATYYAETIVTFETYPPGCGYVLFDGTAYYDNQTVVVANGSAHVANGIPCPGYVFSGWFTTGGVIASGNVILVYGSGILEAVFQQGAITDFVAFITNPGNCGHIEFGGQNYSGGGFTQVPPNSTIPITPWACQGYGFVGWTISLGITIVNGTAYVNGSGSIQANFHPLVDLILTTFPMGCGSIVVNGVTYQSGQTALLPAPNTYPVSATPCAHYGLSYWATSSGDAVANGTLSLYSGATLSAIFEPLIYSVVLTLNPATCGGIRVTSSGSSSQYTNNTTVALPYGTYTVKAAPCSGFHLDHWVVSGAVTIANANASQSVLTVGGAGGLLGVYLPATPVVSLAAPSSVYAGTTISLSVLVQTPVPPYTYVYDWSFGDGTNASTAVNFTTHSYALTGKYVVEVTVHDPYKRAAVANLTISVVNGGTTGVAGIGLAGYLAIAVALVAVVAAVLLARRPPRVAAEAMPPAPPAGGGGPKPEQPPSGSVREA